MIKTLLNQIPRYAEENGDFYSASRQELTKALCSEKNVSEEVAQNTIDLIENLLDTLAVLNPDDLKKGEWCFISFPAQLLAMSLLTAMSNKNARFFDKKFWNTRDISNSQKDEQRSVLKYVENQRVTHGLSEKNEPIRHIYVAWGIIKLDDKILLYQREDTQKRFDKSAGDYGLIGGRLNQTDMKSLQGNMKECLQILQSDMTVNNAEILKESLFNTLKRELKEEAGLEFETHYTFEKWLTLEPYYQVQGAAPNHAYTKYHFEISQIKLTLKGYLSLQHRIKTDENLVWFSIDEVIASKRTDGKIAYLKAIVEHFKNNSAELSKKFNTIPNSFEASYLYQSKRENDYALTVPATNEDKILFGFKGKEKPLGISLTEKQLTILLGLAVHGRGFEFENPTTGIIFHPNGWIEIDENNLLANELRELSVLFLRLKAIIESQDDCFFRLSVIPQVIHFDDHYFNLSFGKLNGQGNNTDAILARKEITTAFGTVPEAKEKVTISLELANGLRNLILIETAADNDEAIRIQDNCKTAFTNAARLLGLKSLVRHQNGMMKFCIAVSH